MNDQLLINPITKKLLLGFSAHPSGSLLLLGSEDDGVEDAINFLRSTLLGTDGFIDSVEVKPENNKALTVEQIRELRTQLRTKVRSANQIARMAIIFRIDTATREAQNGLLKLLEEPVAQTLLVLTADAKDGILPTILSRSQVISLLPIDANSALAYAASHISEEDARRNHLLAEGKAQLYKEMVMGSSSQKLDTIADAKAFLQATQYNRLQDNKKYETKETLEVLLKNIELIASAGLHNAKGSSIARWKHILEELRLCRNLLKRNGASKLVFLRLCVTL